MTTIKKEISVKSTALMTGLDCEAKLIPSTTKGIRFYFDGHSVEANVENVVSTEHCTVIGNQNIKVMLIEHFMAACALCHIDSLDVYLSHYELPILDGAAKKWIDLFNEAGIENTSKTAYKISEPSYYINGKTHLIMFFKNLVNF